MSRDRSDLAIVFASDEKYSRPTGVALYTALEHLSPGLTPQIYVLDTGVKSDDRARLNKIALAHTRHPIRWISVPANRLVEHLGVPHLTSTTYSRLLIPELLPRSITRALYLDGDVVVRDDLSPLLLDEMGGSALAAVQDPFDVTTGPDPSPIRQRIRPRPYFNCGVLVIDLPECRAQRVFDEALGFARSAKEPLPWADQDALNAVLSDWHSLETRWNVHNSEPSRLRRNAGILHFAATPKPWDFWGPSPASAVWLRALRRSGWHTGPEALAWFVPWLSKRSVDVWRRVRVRSRPALSEQ